MKLLNILFLFCCYSAFAQTSGTTVYVKDFGWTITLPPEIQSIDSATLAAEEIENEKSRHWIKKPTDTNYKKLILLIRDLHHHSLSVSSVDTIHMKLDSNFSDYDNGLKKYGESTVSTITFGGVRFYRINTKMQAGGGYTIVELRTPHNGKIYTISYDYNNAKIQETWENILKEGKFDW